MANKLKITQVRSVIRKPARQKRTMEALGLRRMHQTVELNDTPAIRGMIDRVRHLVSVDVGGPTSDSGARKADKTAAKRPKEAIAAASAKATDEKVAEADAVKKAAPTKAATKKSATKKSAAKKSAAKKSAKKPTARKSAAKKSTARKKATTKKATAKKSSAKKSASKKTAAKKTGSDSKASGSSDKEG